MERPRRTGRPWRLVLLPLLLLLGIVSAASDPVAYRTPLANLPSKLVYFEDTPIILSHDTTTRTVHRSTDEGKTWSAIDGVPEGEAWLLIEHAWHNKVAFVLGRGKTHWRTINGGATWQSFETSDQPGMTTWPLSFHSKESEWILFTGQKCVSAGGWGRKVCYDETWVTQDAFGSPPKKILDHTSKCIWAHSTKHFSSPSTDDKLILCIAWEPPASTTGSGDSSTLDRFKQGLVDWLAQARSVRDSRLYASTDFFDKDKRVVDLGLGIRDSRGLVGMGAVQKYLVAAVKPAAGSDEKAGGGAAAGDEMLLFVSEDGANWSRAMFPHGQGLKENAYTIVESTQHSIIVDVLTDPQAATGTLFTSNSNGTYFVKSLADTNRNSMGIVDYEKLVAVEGVSIANVVLNVEEVEAKVEPKRVSTRITFDDGGRWALLRPPDEDWEGKRIEDCDTPSSCSLHVHSVTQPHNFGRVYSSKAPGLLMAVGSIGSELAAYEDCDTFVSTDAGLTWRMVAPGAHKYEFGDQGGILVMIDDEEPTDSLKYSFDFGKTWRDWKFSEGKLWAKLLTGVPDATSQKFLMLGSAVRGGAGSGGEKHVVYQLDFAEMGRRKCAERDFEKWYARKMGGNPDCLMGHKQWFRRRKQDADCVVGEKFEEPDSHEEICACSDEDFECDYNFAPDGDECVPVGPETIPAGQCKNPTDTFRGSSGYRLIPGNTCDQAKGSNKDAKKEKPCSEGQAVPGQVTHQITKFDGPILEHSYFGDGSHTIVAFTNKNRVWQSRNEGYSWEEPVPGVLFMTMVMHPYSRDRAYLVAPENVVYYTENSGAEWKKMTVPLEPNLLDIPLLDFHPSHPDWIIWTGSKSCSSPTSDDCHAIAYYSTNNGRRWNEIDSYVRTCSWGRDKKFKIDERTIFCESYRDKKGSQRGMGGENPLRLISGERFYGSQTTLFDSVVGFATFEEYMVAAQVSSSGSALDLHVSMDGKTFALGKFPPNLRIENQAYTVLESTTNAVFLHVTTHSQSGSEWGSLFKSNSNGTYYSISLEHVNRNDRGYVDFEKMQGLDGIAVMNVVSNPDEAMITGQKKLITRITHNDGGRWKPMQPPGKDSLGQSYECSSTSCALHIHGYTERTDPRATYSSPSAVGLMMAVGNVGVTLAPYIDSDTFLTRDGGFTWEEIAKDAHLWEYGDQGSILLLANDEAPTDRVKYSLNEGKTWQDYVFGESVRVRSIVTVPDDTSRKFILFGQSASSNGGAGMTAVHLDFSKVTNVKCVLDLADPNNDDFEVWSPSESRDEQCLFGRQVLYYRRVREPKRLCYVGDKLPQPHKVVRQCLCSEEDFECEFNHRRDPRTGKCVLVEGATALATDEAKNQCTWDQAFWFDRTEFRKIPYSTCEGGLALDQGDRHTCPHAQSHGWFWWGSVVVAPVALLGLIAFWWMRRRGLAGFRRGAIALPEPNGRANGFGGPGGGKGDLLETLASVPWFVVGVSTAVWGYVTNLPLVTRWFGGGSRHGYRQVSLDDDAELLQDYDD